MSNNLVPVLILIAAGSGAIAVIAYYIIRFMRGSIKLFLRRTAVRPGDIITGGFDLHTKKAIQGNKLTISLIGVQITKTRKGGKTRTHSEEIYRDEVIIEQAKAYPAGRTAKYKFELTAPNMSAPEFRGSSSGQTFGAVLRLLSNKHTRLKWKVEARLDAKGVDLAASAPVTITM